MHGDEGCKYCHKDYEKKTDQGHPSGHGEAGERPANRLDDVLPVSQMPLIPPLIMPMVLQPEDVGFNGSLPQSRILL